MSLIQRIDALLPQTQCGKCGHPGCKPYAEGLAQGEAINKCPPGGKETIAELARLLLVPVLELDTERGHAPAQIAFIREAECIGCTKCIQACPVDAIVGAAKLMHTVIIDECTGCDLCVAPCPVDCIEMRPLPASVLPIVGGLVQDETQRQARADKRNHARRRFDQRTTRLRREEDHKQAERLARAQRPTPSPSSTAANPVQDAIERVRTQKAAAADASLKKARIDLAMSRAQLNKSLKAFGHPPIAEQAAQLVLLQQQFEVAEQTLITLEALSPPAPPVPPANDAELKRAKIQLAMCRAALKKAQDNEATTEELSALSNALAQAERALHDAEELCEKPAPILLKVEKRPIDAQLRRLKTEAAYARADLSKLQRQPSPEPDLLAKALERLKEAEHQVEHYVSP